jgi:hypothetical protein
MVHRLMVVVLGAANMFYLIVKVTGFNSIQQRKVAIKTIYRCADVVGNKLAQDKCRRKNTN